MAPLSFLPLALLQYANCLTKVHDEPKLTESVSLILSHWRSKGEISKETERTLNECCLTLLADVYESDSWPEVETHLMTFVEQLKANLSPPEAAA